MELLEEKNAHQLLRIGSRVCLIGSSEFQNLLVQRIEESISFLFSKPSRAGRDAGRDTKEGQNDRTAAATSAK
jgi:hypothetical protein